MANTREELEEGKFKIDDADWYDVWRAFWVMNGGEAPASEIMNAVTFVMGVGEPSPLEVSKLVPEGIEGAAMYLSEEHGYGVEVWVAWLKLLSHYLSDLESQYNKFNRSIEGWRNKGETWMATPKERGTKVVELVNQNIAPDFGQHLRLVLDHFVDEEDDYLRGLEDGDEMSDHIYLSLAILETYFPVTPDRSLRALLQCMKWVEQGLPHPDVFDASIRQLTDEHRKYYDRFLHAHMLTFGHDVGIMPPSWSDPRNIPMSGEHDESKGTGRGS